MLGRQFRQVETMLRDTAEELLAFTAFPVAHWRKVWSTNPLERHNKGTAPSSLDTRGGWLGGQCQAGGDGLVLDRGEASEGPLASAAVVGALDPGDDRQA